MRAQETDPIIACSTGNLQNTAIGVIRLSNVQMSEIKEFLTKSGPIEPRKAYFLGIRDPKSGVVLDDVVLTYFKGPESYNGEDIIEISVHGNQLNIERIIDLFTDNNIARLAGPGEFTARALENNKLSLSQVEGLDLFLNAKSKSVLDSGFQALSGDLHDSYLKLHKLYVDLKSSVELSIDFLDDVGEEQANTNLKRKMDSFFSHVQSLKARTDGPLNTLLNPDIVLVGKPNAGKSSLFNLLLKTKRSIVTEIAGTTRDYVTEFLPIEGTHFRLIDTAGLRVSEDEVEKAGIEFSKDFMKKALIKIAVVNPYDFGRDDLEVFEGESFDLLVLTHRDQSGPIEPDLLNSISFSKYCFVSLSGPIEPKNTVFKSGPIEPVGESGPIEPLNIDEVYGKISSKYLKLLKTDEILIPRHREQIKNIYKQFNDFNDLVSSENDIAIISSELQIIGQCVEELIGYVKPEMVLSNIFDHFCIGK